MTEIRNIFVSKANAMTADQSTFWNELRTILRIRNLYPVTLGETIYTNCTPIEAVRKALLECQGAIILGFSQMWVDAGRLKPQTSQETVIRNVYFPTAWNHIEAGMAFMQKLPVFIIRERGISGGVFDPGITDRYIHEADLSVAWLRSERFIQPFSEWFDDVLRFPPVRSFRAGVPVEFSEREAKIMNFDLGDTVKIKNGGPEVFTIRQASSDGPRYLLQLGNDGAKIQWKNEDDIELVAKATKPDDGPRFVPGRGIMG